MEYFLVYDKGDGEIRLDYRYSVQGDVVFIYSRIVDEWKYQGDLSLYFARKTLMTRSWKL